jgi:hypothetical protein
MSDGTQGRDRESIRPLLSGTLLRQGSGADPQASGSQDPTQRTKGLSAMTHKTAEEWVDYLDERVAVILEAEGYAHLCSEVAAFIRAQAAEIQRLIDSRLIDEPCPHIVTGKDGTNHCSLAERTAAEIAALRECLKECADDLAYHLDKIHEHRHEFPHSQGSFDLDMVPVVAARALLKGPTP